MSENITQLLLKWSEGDKTALDQLMPLVYDELRRLARSFLRRHGHPDTLQPTVLVHEAYLRLINQKQVTWQNRTQFFGLAARIMRNLLVDHVRERRAEKRGGGEYHLSLSHAEQVAANRPEEKIDLLALDEALERLAGLDPQQGRIVELRYFGGLTIDETAEFLGMSHSSVERDWSAARAWLYTQLNG